MRRLAVLIWGLVVLLALVIVWQQRPPAATRGMTAAVPAPELALWAPARPAAPPAQVVTKAAAPVTAMPASIPSSLPGMPARAVTPAKSASCARLGIFPDADWASQVGQLLLPKAEQRDGLGWVVKAYPGQRYYVVFNGLDAEALAQRLKDRKASLRRRVSATAHPEDCS